MQPTDVIELLVSIYVIAQIGLVCTMSFGQLLYEFGQVLGKLPMFEPPTRQQFQEPFDNFVDWLHDPLGPKVASLDLSPDTTQIVLHLTVAIVVLAGVVVIEFVGLFALSGLVVAGHHYAGVSLDLFDLYRPFVATLALLAFAVMYHSKQRIRHRSRRLNPSLTL